MAERRYHPGSEAFMDAAVTGLLRKVRAGELPPAEWEQDGPYKLPNPAGGAVTYTSNVEGYDVTLRRYRPYHSSRAEADSNDWCYSLSVARDGMGLGWMLTDEPTEALGQLVEAVEALLQPSVAAHRSGFLRALE